MQRIKHIIQFLFAALAGAALAYFDSGPLFTKDSTILYGPVLFIIGVCGFFYQIYKLICETLHRGDTSTVNSSDNATAIVQISEEQKLAAKD